MRTLVLGVGNPLMSDDGVGLRVLEALSGQQPALDDVDYLDAGTLSLLLLPRFEHCDALLVLDAAQLGGAPGDLRVLHGADMDAFFRNARGSVHDAKGVARVRRFLDRAFSSQMKGQGFSFVEILSPCVTFRPEQKGWKEQVHPTPLEPTDDPGRAARRVMTDDGLNIGVLYAGDRTPYPLGPRGTRASIENMEAEFAL